MVIHPEPGSHGLPDMWELFDAMAVSVYMRLSVDLDIHFDFVVLHTAVVCNVHRIFRLLEYHSKADGNKAKNQFATQMRYFDTLLVF